MSERGQQKARRKTATAGLRQISEIGVAVTGDLEEKVLDFASFAPEWYKDAACASAPIEIFFPERGGSSTQARKICCDCPVKLECADLAITTREPFGVWGGMSERDRRRARRDMGLSSPRRSRLPA